MKREKILVSACLLGINCKYDGKNNYRDKLALKLLNSYLIFPICPEFALFGTPRPKIWYIEDKNSKFVLNNKKIRIVSEKGEDLTKLLFEYCYKLSEFVKKLGIKKAVLKERSPSCGVKYIYFNHNKLKKGSGLFTYMLKKQKIKVLSDEKYI